MSLKECRRKFEKRTRDERETALDQRSNQDKQMHQHYDHFLLSSNEKTVLKEKQFIYIFGEIVCSHHKSFKQPKGLGSVYMKEICILLVALLIYVSKRWQSFYNLTRRVLNKIFSLSIFKRLIILKGMNLELFWYLKPNNKLRGSQKKMREEKRRIFLKVSAWLGIASEL